MTGEEQIKQLIKNMAGNKGLATVIATVKEVDEDKACITVDLGEGLLIEEVRLRSIIEDKEGLYVIPELDTKVLLLRIGNADDFVAVAFEKYNKVVCRGAEISFVVTQDNIIFNDNRLESFIPDINKLTDKINQLEGEINDLKAVFRNWAPVPQDGGAQLKIGVTTWAATDIVETTKDDIKDEKILN